MRKKEQKLVRFLNDARAYLQHGLDTGEDPKRLFNTLVHDVNGMALEEECFLPRVTGYSSPEKLTH